MNIKEMWERYLSRDSVKEEMKRKGEAQNKKSAEREMRRKVYFILDKDLVKIGFSEDPESRLNQIKTSRPTAVLLGCVSGGMKLEKEIHQKLGAWKHSREWFYYTAETKTIIEGYLK
jgi:hypothetical protein